VQYLQPFLYFARKPKTGHMNVLIGCLCPLVPFVGEMVLLGYRAQVSEELERDPDLKDHPDIKLDDLMIYLQRGIWPFLARMLFAIIAMPVAYALAFGVGFGVYQIAPEPILGIAAGGVVLIICLILGTTVLWPMEYHAQMTRRFAPIEELKFAIRFARVCWLSTFVAAIMYYVLFNLTTLVGYMLCIVGIYPAFVIQQMAEQHLMSQLYLLYLEEGGEPIRKHAELEDIVDAELLPRAFRAGERE